jgi:hypothetical protein
MCKLNNKFSIWNVFTVIFEICRVKNLFRERLAPQNINLTNTNKQVQRQNFDSEHFNRDFWGLAI